MDMFGRRESDIASQRAEGLLYSRDASAISGSSLGNKRTPSTMDVLGMEWYIR